MKNAFTGMLILSITIVVSSCGMKDIKPSSRPISHAIWDSLLQEHVTEAGTVNYKGFVQDSVRFNAYLNLLSNNHPNNKNWSKDQQLAFWINAYNAYTVQLIFDHYPVESIKDIKKGIPFVNSVWDIKFITIEGIEYDLNNIEHSIIRKQFEEPRIHFAVNCGSISCPRLLNEAFVAERLEEQLAENTRYFLANPVKNRFSNDKLELSKILKWYGGDFDGEEYGDIRGLLQKYGPPHNNDAKIEWLEYDWRLND